MTVPIRGALYTHRRPPPAYDFGWLTTELQNVQRAVPSSVLRTVTSATTQAVSDCYLLCDATTGPLAVTVLPPSRWSPFPLTVIKVDASANAVTIMGTVNGVLNPVLPAQYDGQTIISTIAALVGTALLGPIAATPVDTPNTIVSRDGAGKTAVTALTVTAGEAGLIGGNVKQGFFGQFIGATPVFLLTPTNLSQYYLVISGKDTTDGTTYSNAFVDVVAFGAIASWTPHVISSTTTVGAPGARTYTNSTGTLKVAIASGTTWWIDLIDLKFAT